MRKMILTTAVAGLVMGLGASCTEAPQREMAAAKTGEAESPHGQAIALVLKTRPQEIREIEKRAGSLSKVGGEEGWWFDTTRRAWSVERPFAPGIIDSTHMFVVRYEIGGREVGAWTVDTQSGTVTPESKTPAAAIQSPASPKVAEKDGLQVAVTLDKDVVTIGDPLRFTVRFKNVSKKAMQLLDADHVSEWQVLFAKQGEAGWHVFRTNVAGELKSSAVTLETGQVIEVPMSIEGMDLSSVARVMSQGKEQALKPGKYRMAVEFDLRPNENDKAPAVGYWVGKIRTEPAEFRIVEKPGTT